MTNLQLLQQKILPLNSLEKVLIGLRKQNARIVFTNGCFDILHRGHFQWILVVIFVAVLETEMLTYGVRLGILFQLLSMVQNQQHCVGNTAGERGGRSA